HAHNNPIFFIIFLLKNSALSGGVSVGRDGDEGGNTSDVKSCDGANPSGIELCEATNSSDVKSCDGANPSCIELYEATDPSDAEE
ncbi:hypothetical protein BGY98DRAFT_1005210, partial [Russula aff. rugulosa BPL654]